MGDRSNDLCMPINANLALPSVFHIIYIYLISWLIIIIFTYNVDVDVSMCPCAHVCAMACFMASTDYPLSALCVWVSRMN